jgi:hypothetical protein
MGVTKLSLIRGGVDRGYPAPLTQWFGPNTTTTVIIDEKAEH